MEQSGEEISVLQQHDSLPVNLTQKGLSSDESEIVESEEELKNSVSKGEHDAHVDFKMEVSEQKMEKNHSVDQVEILSLSEESDYEEPKKINGISSFTVVDETVPVEVAKEPQATAIVVPEVLSDNVDSAQPAEGNAAEKKEEQFSDNPVKNEDCKVDEDKSSCHLHCDNLPSEDTSKEVDVHSPAVKPEEEKLESESQKPVEKEENEIKSNGQEQEKQEEEAPRVDDILPPTGSAKRLVQQWSNIDALKTSSTSGTNSDSAPKYPPNTAKTIAAKFSAGITEDQEAQKPRNSVEPSEHLPSQGQARGLIAKFSAMHA